VTATANGPPQESTPSIAVYQEVCARWVHTEVLQWQVPSLSLAAQAFLFTVELGSGTSRTARIMAAALSIVLNTMTLQLLTRHRRAAVHYGTWIEDYERDYLKVGDAHPAAFNHCDRCATKNAGGPLGNLPAFKVWCLTLPIFSIVSLMVIVLAAGWPALLSSGKA